MNYTGFKKMTGAIPESQGFEYSLVFLWLNPSMLPLGVVSIKGCTDRIIRIPRMTVNTYGNSVPVIAVGNYAFGNNKNVTDIILSPQTIRIAGNAFSGCTALERIYIPNCIEMIGKRSKPDRVMILLCTQEYISAVNILSAKYNKGENSYSEVLFTIC